jgi:hypothetical protein
MKMKSNNGVMKISGIMAKWHQTIIMSKAKANQSMKAIIENI